MPADQITRDLVLHQVLAARLEQLGPMGREMVDSIAERYLDAKGHEKEAAALRSRRFALCQALSTRDFIVWQIDEPRPPDIGEILMSEPPSAYLPTRVLLDGAKE